MYQYIDHVVCFNIQDSHYHPNEYTILHVFRAPRYDSLVPLNWYEQLWIVYIWDKYNIYKKPEEIYKVYLKRISWNYNKQ